MSVEEEAETAEREETEETEEKEETAEREHDNDTGEVPRPGRLRWLPWALAVVFAATAIVMTIAVASLKSDLDEAESTVDTQRADTADVARVAGRFADAFLSYDHREPTANRDSVLALATGRFKEEYEEAFEGGLAEFITRTEAVSEVTVTEVLVSEISEGTTTAVAVVDTRSTGTGGPRVRQNLYLRLSMVKVEDQWRVADVSEPLNQASEAPGGSTSTTRATTSTTAGAPAAPPSSAP